MNSLRKALEIDKPNKCFIVVLDILSRWRLIEHESILKNLQEPIKLPNSLRDKINVFFVLNKIDLLKNYSSLNRTHLIRSTRNLLDRRLSKLEYSKETLNNILPISTKNGDGLEFLITTIWKKWNRKSNIYVIGEVNSGKTTLFNKLLKSDLCHSDWNIKRKTNGIFPLRLPDAEMKKERYDRLMRTSFKFGLTSFSDNIPFSNDILGATYSSDNLIDGKNSLNFNDIEKNRSDIYHTWKCIDTVDDISIQTTPSNIPILNEEHRQRFLLKSNEAIIIDNLGGLINKSNSNYSIECNFNKSIQMKKIMVEEENPRQLHWKLTSFPVNGYGIQTSMEIIFEKIGYMVIYGKEDGVLQLVHSPTLQHSMRRRKLKKKTILSI
ncbi:hypothetical protein SNEBB_005899 [Seison nebaliae]|nr:hypothetical protein SNEBB_005899 [Seison nebaliae]